MSTLTVSFFEMELQVLCLLIETCNPVASPFSSYFPPAIHSVSTPSCTESVLKLYDGRIMNETCGSKYSTGQKQFLKVFYKFNLLHSYVTIFFVIWDHQHWINIMYSGSQVYNCFPQTVSEMFQEANPFLTHPQHILWIVLEAAKVVKWCVAREEWKETNTHSGACKKLDPFFTFHPGLVMRLR